jgi:hypothetical protein
VNCDGEEKLHIFQTTVGQASNQNWFRARKSRMSASKARQLAFAQKEETLLKYFFGSVVDSDNLRYGRETEPIARDEYANLQSVSVHDSGLVISSSHPWLCASPDGIVIGPDGELIVLEIKCPVSGQTSHIDMPYIKDGK